MRISTLLLIVTTAALAFGNIYFYRRHEALVRDVAGHQQQCAQQIEQLQSEYQAQLAELQRHLLQGR